MAATRKAMLLRLVPVYRSANRNGRPPTNALAFVLALPYFLAGATFTSCFLPKTQVFGGPCIALPPPDISPLLVPPKSLVPSLYLALASLLNLYPACLRGGAFAAPPPPPPPRF